ncbi:viral A-type inclusion protein [uncultured Clostridium sp.]|uniref:viral A-type inclusion protein n=1 Tax=uncultured Clostridium sp. TaxID=59620 RepID=UPI0025E7ABA1|nr:viral A-type inclusion protein [uncultured Clostridium sp.]
MSIRDLPVAALDINNKYTVSLCCKQNDDIILNLSIFDKSVQADLSNYNVRLKAFKADQIPLIQDTKITVTSNNIKIECSKQLTTTACTVKAELQFIEKDTLKKKTTFFMEIEVSASALGGDGTISEATCTLLEEIDNKLDEIENIGEVLDEAKQVRDTLENDISTGNTTHTNIQQSITDANNKKIEVEIAISNANSKITEVDESITNADQSKAELDNSKELADQSKTELDSANTQAAENIAALEALGDVTELAKNVQTNTNNINTLQENVASNTSQLKVLANTKQDKIQDSGWIELALNSDFIPLSTSEPCNYKKNGNTLTLNLNLKKADNSVLVANDIVGVLPSGYAPKYFSSYEVSTYPTGQRCNIKIYNSGQIKVIACDSTVRYIYSNVRFEVE